MKKNTFGHRVLTLAAAGLFSLSGWAQGTNSVVIDPTDTPDEITAKAASVVPSPRQFAWQRQELTAFIHFGMNTFTNREWGEGTESEKTFNPTGMDCDQWVKTLKEAGFKQVVLTCKHHDGFCLWPSAYTEYSVKNSPWMDGKGDVVKMVSDACKKYGMHFGVYLSPWDRNNAAYGTPAYNDYFCNQLTELLTNYGKIYEVWFDGACGEGPNGKKQVYDFPRYYKLIRDLQPDAVISGMAPDCRWVGTETGVGRETEWSVVPNSNMDPALVAAHSQQADIAPPTGDMTDEDLGSRDVIQKAKMLVWYPAETDVSIRPGWFYHKDQDAKVKTPEKLMDIYFTSVGRNGVLLLNVPPATDGRFADADVTSLKGFHALWEKIFSNNLLSGAKVKAAKGENKTTAAAIIDGNYDTSYCPKMSISVQEAGKGEVPVTFTLKQPVRFNVLSLQEDIRKGQRVEDFVLQVKQDGKWKEVAKGTTIGYKRLIKLSEPVTTQDVRLVVRQSRGTPALAEMGLYSWE